jgi:hypothetical protein
MSLHIFFVMLCVIVFYFAYSNRSKFKHVLNSNEFVIYRKDSKIMKFSYSLKWPWAKTPSQLKPAQPGLSFPLPCSA